MSGYNPTPLEDDPLEDDPVLWARTFVALQSRPEYECVVPHPDELNRRLLSLLAIIDAPTTTNAERSSPEVGPSGGSSDG